MSVIETMKSITLYETGCRRIRLGRRGEGGYVVLDRIKDTPYLFTYRRGFDWSFERDFLKLKPDGQVNAFSRLCNPPESLEEDMRITFCGEKLEEGDQIPRQAVLLMEADGREWRYFKKEDFPRLLDFEQIIVRFHFLHVGEGAFPPEYYHYYRDFVNKTNDRIFEGYKSVLDRIGLGFYLFHIHANNAIDYVEVNGCKFPPILEMSFVRRDLIERDEVVAIGKKGHFPTLPDSLDYMSHDDGRNDVAMNFEFRERGE